MKMKLKKFTALFLTLATLFGLMTYIPALATSASAEVNDSGTEPTGYYYNQLKDDNGGENDRTKFYNALEYMLESGMLALGLDLEMTGSGDALPNDKAEINSAFGEDGKAKVYTKSFFDDGYVKNIMIGDDTVTNTLLNDFGAARDAFNADHPDLFYIDEDALTIRISQKGDDYLFCLGSGRRDTYLNEEFVVRNTNETIVEGQNTQQTVLNAKDTANKVAEAIKTYNEGLKKAIEQINSDIEATKKEAHEKGNEFGIYEAIGVIHDYVTHTTSYRLEDTFKDNKNGINVIRTAYGPLVNHKGVCEGYSRLFKVLLDNLKETIEELKGKIGDVLLITGAYRHTPDVVELHMWDYVELKEAKEVDGKKVSAWYGVDCTMDDPKNSKIAKDQETNQNGEKLGVDHFESHEYLMQGDAKFGLKYAPSGVWSESNFEFSYPELERDKFGTELVYSSNGLVVSIAESEMEGEKAGELQISYLGMNWKETFDAGYVFVARYYEAAKTEEGEDTMTDWSYIWDPAMFGNLESNDICDMETGDRHYLKYTLAQTLYIQIGIVKKIDKLWSEDDWGYGSFMSPGFMAPPISESDIITKTNTIYNKNGDYVAPPYPESVTPGMDGAMMIGEGPYNVVYEFDTPIRPKANKDNQGNINSWEPISNLDLWCKVYDMHNIENHSALKHAHFSDLAITYGKYDAENNKWLVDEENGLQTQIIKKGEFKVRDITGTDEAAATIELDDEFELPNDCYIKSVSFTFDPSIYWADDNIFYEFYIKGIGRNVTYRKPYSTGSTSSDPNAPQWIYYTIFKEPVAISFLAAHRCAAYAFKSQGYDWNLFGKPALMDDLSDIDFEGWAVNPDSVSAEELANIQETLKDLAHRMVLVAETPSEGEQKALQDALLDDAENGLGGGKSLAVGNAENGFDDGNGGTTTKKNIEYFNINLTVCKMQVVKTGDAVRVTLGFPQGYEYSPEDEGKTFKVYHFKTDADGKPIGVEEIPVEVTEYGLIVYCDSFSPFAVVMLDKDEVDKNVARLEASGALTPEQQQQLQDTADKTKQDVINAVAEARENKVVMFNTPYAGTIEVINESIKDAEGTSRKGTIVLEPGDIVEVRITAKEGYLVDAVKLANSFVASDNQQEVVITISYDALPNEGVNNYTLEADFIAKVTLDTQGGAASPEHTVHITDPHTGLCQLCGEMADGMTCIEKFNLSSEGYFTAFLYVADKDSVTSIKYNKDGENLDEISLDNWYEFPEDGGGHINPYELKHFDEASGYDGNGAYYELKFYYDFTSRDGDFIVNDETIAEGVHFFDLLNEKIKIEVTFKEKDESETTPEPEVTEDATESEVEIAAFSDEEGGSEVTPPSEESTPTPAPANTTTSTYEFTTKSVIDHVAFDPASLENGADAALGLSGYMQAAAEYVNQQTVSETDQMDGISASDVAQFKPTTSGKLPSGITYTGTTVILGVSNITVRHYFKVTKSTLANKYGLTKDPTASNRYYLDIPYGLQELDIAKECKIGSWKINYTVLGYVYSVLTATNQNEEVVKLAKAIYNLYMGYEA